MAKEKNYLLDSERNIFLTGKAGTGKTYNIRQFVEKMESEGKKVLVCAPTGTAAVNVGGETCHSLFGIPIPCYGVSISKTPASKIKVLASADAVVIDEVSMMRNDAFSYAMRVLKKAEREKGSRIRVVLTGDFSQLPPVVQKKDEKFLKKFGYDLSGYAFTTKEWSDLNLKVVELTKIYRQDEEEFILNLAKVRDGDPTCIPYFNQFVDDSFGETEEEKEFSFDDLEEDSEEQVTFSFDEETEGAEVPVNPKLLTADCVVLCGTNAEADRINRAYLDSLETTLTAYQSSKKGRNANGIVDDIILIKEGAKVMFTVNDVVKNRYQNGTMGVVTMCHKDHVSVRLEDGKLVSVYPHEYTNYSYKISGGELCKSKIGSIKQLPLKIAAAITIHKSQGKTFDKAIISPSVFAAGQLYVALSRVRTPEGLILTAPITERALVENEVVSKFYKSGFSYELPKKSTRSKTVLSTEELDNKPAKKTAKKTTTKKNTSETKSSTKKATTVAKNATSKSASSASSKKTGTKKAKVSTTKRKTSTKTSLGKTTRTNKTTAKPSVKKGNATKKSVTKKTTTTKKPTTARKSSVKK